ncbi:hypothetical protein [Haloferula sp. BvORR071]|uniref:hypothetical protein n=1 Tax=Haloferula sp. BvORR071 TaxID=1396141 RepID=UPI000557B04D|nr:hypothetical protein [Haloferula sp. BvORR071]
MRATTLTIAITVSLLAGSACLVALPHVRKHAAAEPAALSAKAPLKESHASNNSSSKLGVSDGAAGSPKATRVHADINQAREQILQICATGNVADRCRSLARLLENYSSEDYLMAAEALNTLGLGPGSPECRMVLSAWVEKEPAIAMEQLAKAPSSALTPLLGVWAESDPAAAMDWIQRHDLSEKLAMEGQVIKMAMKKDPKVAQAMLEKLTPSEQKWALEYIVPKTLGVEEPAKARAWVEAMPEQLRQAAAGIVISALPGSRTAEKLEWMREYPQLADSSNYSYIYRAWLTSDEKAATTAIDQVAEGPLRNGAYHGVYSAYLLRGNEQAALEYFERSMPEFDEAKLNSFLSEARNDAPLLSLDLVPRLTDESQRNARYQELLGNWRRQDPTAAKEWMEKHELPQAVKEALEVR